MKLGLTGGMGCGKSLACQWLAELGWRALSADAVVRRLLAEDAAVIAAAVARWGPAVRGAGGGLDRAALAERVFGDDAELAWFEGLLHPRTGEAWAAFVAAAPAGARLVYEVPLLFEKDLAGRFDRTAAVVCSPAVQRARLRARGMAEADIDRRLAKQLSLEEKAGRADFVLHNDGEPDFLRAQVRLLDAAASAPAAAASSLS